MVFVALAIGSVACLSLLAVISVTAAVSELRYRGVPGSEVQAGTVRTGPT